MRSFTQRIGQSVELDAVETAARLHYRFESGLPKPCVHPLVSDAGVCLSGFQMSDHVWHRGLWFTIKFINGENFWEEHPPFGVQVSAAEPRVGIDADESITIDHDLSWVGAPGVVMGERRRLRVGRWSPSVRTIEWTSRLQAASDLILDRTPFTTWGGYGGLSFRGSRELHEARFHLPDAAPCEAVSGQPVPWFMMTAKADGSTDRRVSMGVACHPGNARSPQPVYAKSGAMVFWNYAFLFNEPMPVKADEVLTLRYLVALCDGTLDRDEFAAIVERFSTSGH